MNAQRRAAALKRNIDRLERELVRIQELRQSGDSAIQAFPQKTEEYIAGIRTKISEYKAELARIGTNVADVQL